MGSIFSDVGFLFTRNKLEEGVVGHFI